MIAFVAILIGTTLHFSGSAAPRDQPYCGNASLFSDGLREGLFAKLSGQFTQALGFEHITPLHG